MPALDISPEALDIYALFKHKLAQIHGSKAAKPTTIQTLIEMCARLKPKRVLEIGGGNGTITYTILKYSQARVDTYEQLEFCRTQMRRNLAEFNGRCRIVESYSTLPPERDYDLVIIDGGEAHDDENGCEEVAGLFLSYLRSVKVVYIEGRRGLQRKQARYALSRKGVYRIVRHPDISIPEDLDVPDEVVERAKKVFAGGQEIRFTQTNNFLLKFINFIYWETLIGLNAIVRRLLHFIRKFSKKMMVRLGFVPA